MNYSPRVSLRSLWAHETFVGVQSALLWKSRPQWCENVLQCIQKKTRMGSLPFTIHNISHHNKKRSPRSFEKEVKVNTYALHTFLHRTLSNCRFAIWALNRRVSKHLIEKKEGSELKEAHTYKVCGVHISRRWLYMWWQYVMCRCCDTGIAIGGS